ncbi:hypothetical protein LSAT2_017607 [Lamellibrachia satsuma]|nr:hypothetical protein LSAT2_017607 [Lamellibrachia satsuma]
MGDLNLSAIFDELLRVAMEKKVPQILLQIYSHCIAGLASKDIVEMRLQTHREIVLFLYAHRQFDASWFQEAVLVANHATVCGLYPEQPKPLHSGSCIKLWTCMSQQEMYLVTYAYLQELKQKLHNIKSLSSSICNVRITLEKLPDEPRYEDVFGSIMGTVKVHQHRIEQMAQNDFDPPLSGVWAQLNVFQVDSVSVETYLKKSSSSMAKSGPMAPTRVVSFKRQCSTPTSKKFVKHALVDGSSELSSCVSSFSQNALPSLKQQVPADAVSQGYGVSSFGRDALPSSESPLKQRTPGVTATRGYGVLSFDQDALPSSESPLKQWTPGVTATQGYGVLSFDQNALPPSVSPVNQETPAVGVKRDYSGLTRVNHQMTVLGDLTRNISLPKHRASAEMSSQDSRSYSRTTRWSQPSMTPPPAPSRSLPGILPALPPGTDFSVPPPPVIPAVGHSTPDGASKRLQTVVYPHSRSGQLNPKRCQLWHSHSVTPDVQYTDTSDVSASGDADTVYTDSDDRFDINMTSSLTCDNSESKWSRVNKSWGTGSMGDKSSYLAPKGDTERRGKSIYTGADKGSKNNYRSVNRGADTSSTSNKSSYPTANCQADLGSRSDKSGTSASWGTGIDRTCTNWGMDIKSRGDKSNYPVASRNADTYEGSERSYAAKGERSSYPATRWGADTSSQGDKSIYPATRWGSDTSSQGDKSSYPATRWGDDTTSQGDKSSYPATRWGADTSSHGDKSCYPDTRWGDDTTSQGNKSSYPATRWGDDTTSRGDKASYSATRWGGDTSSQGDKSSYPATRWGDNTTSQGDQSSYPATRWGDDTTSQGDKCCYPATRWGADASSQGDKSSYPATRWGDDTTSQANTSSYPATRWGDDTTSRGDKSSYSAKRWDDDTSSRDDKSSYLATRWVDDTTSRGDQCSYPATRRGGDTNSQSERSSYQTNIWETDPLTRGRTVDQLSGLDMEVSTKVTHLTSMYKGASSVPDRIITPPVHGSTQGQGHTLTVAPNMRLGHSQKPPGDTGRHAVTSKVLEAVCDRLQFHVRQQNISEQKCDIVSGGIMAKFCEKYVTDSQEFTDELFNTLVEFVDEKVAILQS